LAAHLSNLPVANAITEATNLYISAQEASSIYHLTALLINPRSDELFKTCSMRFFGGGLDLTTDRTKDISCPNLMATRDGRDLQHNLWFREDYLISNIDVVNNITFATIS
jgi:hypothetical protein